MPRPIRAVIDLSSLRRNYRVARQFAGGARLWAVIKADGYGHGMARVAGALSGLADGFAVICTESALAMRREGIDAPMLLLEGFFSPAELGTISQNALVPVLHRPDQVEAVIDSKLPMAVYLKLNTGMNRLGLNRTQFLDAYKALKAASHVSSITLMTHFADADGEGIDAPLAAFEEATRDLPAPTCLANSAALLRFPKAIGDWARPGIMLYGASPMPQKASAAELGLKPVMTLQSELIAIHDLAPGDRVGYGGTFTAERAMRIGTVACGYGDGYPRHAPNGTPVLVGGARVRLVGRVSMDMITVDLTDAPHARVGDPVVLWGEGLPVEDVATAAGTISYELLTARTARVALFYREGD